MNTQLSLPVRQTASVLEMIDAHVRSNPLTRGLVICTGALRRCIAAIGERDRRAAEQLMQLELQLLSAHWEDERKQSKALQRIAEIKGLLCALMIALTLLGSIRAMRVSQRRHRQRDEIELVAAEA